MKIDKGKEYVSENKINRKQDWPTWRNLYRGCGGGGLEDTTGRTWVDNLVSGGLRLDLIIGMKNFKEWNFKIFQ